MMTNHNDVEFTGTQYGAFERVFEALKDEHYPTIYEFRDEMISAGMNADLMRAMTAEWIARNT